MRRRPGLTLTEVLVTLAILSFGVLAVLTLFPLAASQMAIAVREDRSAQAANAADGYLRAYWKSEVVDKVKAGDTVTEPFYEALTNPNDLNVVPAAELKPLMLPAVTLPFLPAEASYPVFIDPMGFAARTGGSKYWVGDNGGASAPRRSLSKLTTAQQAFRTCSLMDGLGYDENGHPTPDRELRYNWMWVVQRPDNREQLKADMTVLVYDRRAHMYAPTGSEGWFTTLGVTVAGSTTVTLSYTGAAPDVRPGTWIAEVTQLSITLPPTKVRNANFYQVVSSKPGAAPLTLDIELNLPLKVDAAIGVSLMKFVVLRGVSGVYPRPQLTDN
ncbi:type IV pilus modification PilV family protein [Gemmata sp.]|uniref:type IV pilus modification PilV family protein n=1 Tax=Gemmata sp. TaxID=1914242 RepID=UPI003F6FE545